MEPEIICKQSAFRHNATLNDIRWAFITAKYDMPVEGGEEKRLLIGFNTAGNPLEVLYNELDDGRISVFHAMPCRSMYAALLSGEE
ncbi:MAG: hypothetical protein LBS82_03035 [Spirochaetaceae bacterium]|jgi:hypothetical protein|nr:hypothetical protein [Spirochaetaceae bacterium]